jgi:hypothetical protein
MVDKQANVAVSNCSCFVLPTLLTMPRTSPHFASLEASSSVPFWITEIGSHELTRKIRRRVSRHAEEFLVGRGQHSRRGPADSVTGHDIRP